MDRVSKKIRSKIMALVKSKNTTPEVVVRKILHSAGYRFRLHVKNLPGKPDIVLEKYKTVVFVNGCFWHGHPRCRYARLPKSNRRFWIAKRKSNTARDRKTEIAIKKLGYRAFVIWQCRLKKKPARAAIAPVLKILKRLKNKTCKVKVK